MTNIEKTPDVQKACKAWRFACILTSYILDFVVALGSALGPILCRFGFPWKLWLLFLALPVILGSMPRQG